MEGLVLVYLKFSPESTNDNSAVDSKNLQTKVISQILGCYSLQIFRSSSKFKDSGFSYFNHNSKTLGWLVSAISGPPLIVNSSQIFSYSSDYELVS